MLFRSAEKAFNKIQHPFVVKVLERSGTQGPYLNIIKAIYSKAVANIRLNGVKLETIPSNQGLDKTDYSLPTHTIQYLKP